MGDLNSSCSRASSDVKKPTMAYRWIFFDGGTVNDYRYIRLNGEFDNPLYQRLSRYIEVINLFFRALEVLYSLTVGKVAKWYKGYDREKYQSTYEIVLVTVIGVHERMPGLVVLVVGREMVAAIFWSAFNAF